MDEQKKEVSAQAQPETAEPMQTDEINEQTVQIEQAEVEMAAESAAEAERTAQPEGTEPQASASELEAEPENAPAEEAASAPVQTELSQAQAELQAVADQTASVQEELPEEPERVTVVDVRFRNNAKTYFFDPGELRPGLGAHVIIETARGDEFGICAGMRHEVKASEIVPPLRKVLRLATAQDERINRDNQEKEKRAFEVCQQKIADHKLDMQLVSAEVAFDGSKILFFFTAEGRVDFRELVKDLASSFRTRIELRQIGVRDKAKMVGGLGVCGRPFCCKEFLDDFQPVSIKMAKTQNLSLNPTKISGTCGRLMCCLKYEQEAYEDLLKTAPKNESFVDTPDGRGTVTEVNLLRQCVKVRMEESPDTIGCYKNCDICVLRSGKARKNDPPIPKDLAPISSKPRKLQPKEEGLFEPLPELIYPDQVSEFDQKSAFGAQSDLLSGRDIPLTPEVPEQPEPGDKAAEEEAAARELKVRRKQERRVNPPRSRRRSPTSSRVSRSAKSGRTTRSRAPRARIKSASRRARSSRRISLREKSRREPQTVTRPSARAAAAIAETSPQTARRRPRSRVNKNKSLPKNGRALFLPGGLSCAPQKIPNLRRGRLCTSPVSLRTLGERALTDRRSQSGER